jgi:hypothetical protein
MRKAVANFCDQCEEPWNCNYATVVYNEPLDEYGIVLRDRDAEYVLIRYCPWCAARLPDSQRDRWFDALEARGFESPLEARPADLPPEFLTGAWRHNERT